MKGNALDWPVRDQSRLIEIQLRSQRPQGKVLPGYDGDWCDLVATMLDAGGHQPRRAKGKGGHERLAQLATAPKVLGKVMRNVIGRNSLTAWQEF